MSKVLSGLEPARVFQFFEEICNIPHGTGNTGALREYIADFAKEKGLESRTDEAGNIVIHVPASKGAENAATVLLQAHLDMVCEKNDDSRHNFRIDPLDLSVMDDDVYARGTTLGAEGGAGVAICLALLDSPEIVHPELELVRIVPSSSESKPIIYLACRSDISNACTPFMVSASSAVKTSSSAGWTMSGESKSARQIATPAPPSAPRVVPLAYISSSMTLRSNGSFLKLCLLSSFFSHTISR